jgi:hypothetical protein
MNFKSLAQALSDFEAKLPKARIVNVSTNFKNLAYMRFIDKTSLNAMGVIALELKLKQLRLGLPPNKRNRQHRLETWTGYIFGQEAERFVGSFN